MPGNIGIAAAQNYGVRYAIENNFDYLFFLDQDSISPANIINELLLQYDYLCSNFMTVGAIGPRAFNRCENKEYRGNVKKGKKINNEITEVSELISSASLIAISNFEKVWAFFYSRNYKIESSFRRRGSPFLMEESSYTYLFQNLLSVS